MRVGLFAECYEPVQNGVTVSIRTLVAQLRARGHRVIVVAPRFARLANRSRFTLRVPSFHTPINPQYPVAWPWFPKLRRAFGRIRPDIVHSHSPFIVGLLAARIARQCGVPLVSTYHTLYHHYAHYLPFLPYGFVQALLRWWMPTYYNQCRLVIAPSRVAEGSLRSFGVTAPVRVIPTAVAIPETAVLTQESASRARAAHDIPEGVPLLLYVGRIAQEKNIETILLAFTQVASTHPTAHLLVVGDGPHLEACRRFALERCSGVGIHFTGAIPHSQLAPLYAAADLFVFGSTTETQGLVMAEARAAGTPCVVARGGGASETVVDGEDGLVVDPVPAAFASAIGGLLGSPERLTAMRLACRRNALNHTPEAMADQVMAAYELALAGKPTA